MREIIVILDNIRSAHNVGAIMRTCDGAGVLAIYLCGITPSNTHPKVKKTAIGAEDFVEVLEFKDTQKAIEQAKSLGYTVIAVEQFENSKKVGELKLPQKCCFVFGNELTGLSPVIINMCDLVLELPMYGKKNSLNVATTAGIIIYLATIYE